ncbi:MAG: MFS transporter [Candidatus Altiarchaeota archaeon]
MPRLFGRDYRRVTTISGSALLYALGTSAFWFILPILAEKTFNDLLLVGLIIAVPNMVSLLFDIPLGRLSDKIGRKGLISIGLLILVLLGFALSSLRTLPVFILFMIVFGFANLLIIVPARAYVMETTPENKRSEFFGIFESLIQIGFTVGPIIAGYLITDNFNIGLTDTGILFSLSCLLAFFIILLIQETITVKEPVLNSIKTIVKTDWIYLKGLREFKTLRAPGAAILLTTFILIFIDGIIWSMEPLYTKQGLDATTVGYIMAMFVAPFILLEAPTGWLADRVGKTKLFITGLIIAGISLILFGLTTDPTALIILAFTATAGLAVTSPALDGLLSDLSANKMRGNIVGVWDVAEDSAYIVSPIVGGLIAQIYGIGATFIFIGCLPLIGLPIIYAALKKGASK